MKHHLKYFFLFLFFSFFLKGQVNLVPNPSFEIVDTLHIPCQSQMNVAQLSTAFPILLNWYSSTDFGTPDYMNICATPNSFITFAWTSAVPKSRYGYQMPRTGNAYVSMSTYVINDPFDSIKNDVEYISVKLNSTLKNNVCYYAEFYASLADYCELGVNQLSILFTSNTFTTATYSFTNTIQPQIQWDTTKYFTDTLNWIKISDKFVSQGGEQYLTIGNFKDGIHTKKIVTNSNFVSPQGSPGTRNFSFVFIDDVALYELPTPQLQYNAITICPNADSLVLGDTARIHSRYQWFANGTAIDTTSFIKVKPNQTTTYVLQTTQCGINTQSIVVTYSNNCEPIVVVEPVIPNVFTPNADSINDVWRFSLGKGNVLTALNIYNRWGNLILQTPYTSASSVSVVNWDGRTTSGEETPSGVYFYVLQYTDANGDTHKKNGYISLIR